MAVAVAEERPKHNIRTKFRDYADAQTDKLFAMIEAACDAEKSYQAVCPRCNTGHPVKFPDVRAQMDALKFLVEQGHGAVSKAPVDRPEGEGESTEAMLEGLSDEQREGILALLRSAPDDHAAPDAGVRVRHT